MNCWNYKLIEKTLIESRTEYKVERDGEVIDHLYWKYGGEGQYTLIGWIEKETKRGWTLALAYLCHRIVYVFLPRSQYEQVRIEKEE